MSSRSFRVGLTLTLSLLVLLLLFIPVMARDGVSTPIAPKPLLASGVLLNESFDGVTFPPTNWGTTNVTGTTQGWSRQTSGSSPTISPHSGAAMARYNSFSINAGDSTRLFTPILDTTGQTTLNLKFYMSHDSGFSTDNDRIQVQISIDGGVTYSDLGAPISRYDATCSTACWKLHTFDLSAYVGLTNTRIGLLAISAFGNNFFVDDVSVGPPAPDYSTSTKSVSPSGTRFSGDVVTYTVVVLNSGDLTGTATTLSDPIPSGAAFVPGSAALTGSGTLTATGSSIDWGGSLVSGDRITVTFQVTLTAINGSVTNTATISDPLITTPVVKSVVTPIAVPNYSTSTKVVSPNVHPGQRATYTVTLINSGLVAGTSTTLSDPIPTGTTYVDGSAQVAGGGTLTATASSIDWSGSIAPSGRVTVTFQATLTAQSGSVVNTATINDPLLLAPVVKSATTAIQSPTGGPDGGGYTYKDSYAAGGPTFTWVFTTGASTLIPSFTGGNDDGYAQIPLGFDFRFYTGVYSQPFVGTNGFVSFGASSSSAGNAAIPNTLTPNNFAACFWDDLISEAAGQGVWYETFGVAPNRYTVVTWRMAAYLGTLPPPYEFQMILYEGTNQILCQYRSTTGYADGNGASATVGVENATGAIGLQYSYNTAGATEDNLAIRFDPGAGYAASTKSVQPTGSVTPGQVLTYTVVVANGGALTGTATMNDPIPAGMTFVPGTAALTGGGTLTATGSAVDWSGSLVSGDRVTVTFQVTVTAISGAITNTAVISDPLLVAPVVKTASNPIVCNLPAGLSFTYDPLAPLANQTIDFSGTVVSGLQPFAYTWDFADSSPLGAGNPITHAYTTAATYNVVMTVTNVCGANSYTAPITVTSGPTPPALGPLQSSSPTALGNATFFTGTLLGGSVPITYTWDFGDSTIVVGGLTINHTYTSTGSYIALLTADNVSGTATVSTTVNVGIPPTASFDATNPTFYPATTVFTYTGNPGTPPTAYLWNFGDGVTSTLQNPSHAYAAPLAVNTYTATLNVLNSYGAAVTNTVITVINNTADLSISKTDSPDPVPGGTPLTYTLSVTNGGPSPVMGAPITTVLFSNTGVITINDAAAATPYPSTISVSGITDLVGQVKATLYGISHTFPDDIDVLLVSPAGQKLLLLSDAGGSADVSNVTLTFDDNAASFVPDGGPLVSGTFKPTNYGTGDTFPAPAPAGPYASALSTFAGVNPNGTWSLFVVDDLGGDFGAINGGWSLSFTTVQPLTTTVVDTLPAGYGFGSATGTGWTCGNASGTVTCTRSVFPVGRAPDIVITGNAPTLASSGNITNTATVNSTVPDGNPINNTATITTFVNTLRSDLSVVKTGTPGVAALNSAVTYQITATNGGPDATTGVIVTDTLPSGMTFASATGGCSYAAGKVTCLVGSMANNATFNASIVVTATAYGTFTNTVSVVGDNPDLTPGNNTATASTSVVWPEITSAPGNFTAMQAPDKVTTQTLTISNVGVVPLTWSIWERPNLFEVPELLRAPIDFGEPVAGSPRIEKDAASREKPVTSEALPAPANPNATVYVSEGFEAGLMPPTGWLTRTFSSSPRKWTLVDAVTYPTFVHSGAYAGWVNYDSTNQQNEWLISPPITVPARMITASVTFWAESDTAFPTASMTLYAIEAGGTFTDTLWDLVANENWPTFTYRQVSRSLMAYQGKTIRLAWHYHGIDGDSFGLDDILVSGTAAACQTQNALPWITALPNSGTTAPGGNSNVSLVFDSTGLTTGVYTGTLCIDSNDQTDPTVLVPVSLTVKIYSVYLPVIRR